jgi:hypothetical protein
MTWIAAAVKARNDRDLIIRRRINQSVGKTLQTGTSKPPKDGLIFEGVSLNGKQSSIDSMDEFRTQSPASVVVPVSGFDNFRLSPWLDDPIEGHS